MAVLGLGIHGILQHCVSSNRIDVQSTHRHLIAHIGVSVQVRHDEKVAILLETHKHSHNAGEAWHAGISGAVHTQSL